MIVVEGPDGAGKTTLIEQITQELEIPIAPRASASKEGPVIDLHGWTTRSLNQHIRGVVPLQIHDRYPLLSEPIYGPLVRGAMRPGFGTPWFKDAWEAFIFLRPIVVFCLPPVDEVVANVSKPPIQMDGVVMNIRAIYWQYYTLMQRLRGEGKITVMFWDYTDARADNNMRMIFDRLIRRKG